jgi:hypothetical protein
MAKKKAAVKAKGAKRKAAGTKHIFGMGCRPPKNKPYAK